MSAVRVCPDKDIECGTTPKLWCSRCPNWSSESGRNTLLDRIAALEAERAALLAAIAAAGLTAVKTANGHQVIRLGPIEAQTALKETP